MDIVTFSVAIATVLLVPIPQLAVHTTEHHKNASIWQQLTFGFHYIIKRPGLLALVVSASLFWFAHDLGGSVATPMILARTENDGQILGSIFSIAGIGGVTGAVLLSVWGGPRRRIHGYLLGMVGAGVSKAIFGLGQSPQIWLPAQFCSSLNFPLLESSQTAILLAKVAPEVQGRVFAARSLMFQLVSAIASLIAGPLADNVFEPAMQPGGNLARLLGGVFGTHPGAGMAVMYVSTSTCLLLVGLGGYACHSLRDLDDRGSD
jgi:MFS transporter, DHA3 family, macrolide efflux protein